MPSGIYIRTKENNKKHSFIMKKIMANPLIREKISNTMKGRPSPNKGKHTTNAGTFKKGHITWIKGLTKDTDIRVAKLGKKTSKSKTGRKRSPHSKETKNKIREAHFGEKNPQWKGGISPLVMRIRDLAESREWRIAVFKRDNYTCRDCYKQGDLIAHHKIAFALLFQNFLKEYNQFSVIEDKETLIRLALNYKPFWDIDNGRTLCKECHRLTNNYARNIKRTISCQM